MGTVTGADITIEDAVVKPGTPLVTRTKSSVKMNPALDVRWTAPTNAGDAVTGYKAQYRKQGAANWTAYTGTLSATTTSLNLAGLEAGATYEVQVLAVRGTTDGPWSDTGSGKANSAPTRTLTGRTQGQQVDVPWGGTDDIHPIGKYFADADGDTLTFVATTAHPGIIRLTIEGDDSDKKLRIHFLNPVEVPITFGAHDGYGGYSEDWLTINPIANLDRNILENSPAGTLVGDPVTGTPYNGAALSYTLAGNQADTEPFAINAETGQISLAEGASLDYETDNLYYVDVQWTVQGKTASADVTINVTDVGPGKPNTPTVTRTTFSRQSDPALDVSWTAPDANGLTITGYEVQYRKHGGSWTTYSYKDANDVPPAPTVRVDHQHQPAEPGGRRDLRGPGARAHQHRGNQPLVGHRLRRSQHAAEAHCAGHSQPRLQSPVGRRRLRSNDQRRFLRRRRRHADVLGLNELSRRAYGRHRGRRFRHAEDTYAQPVHCKGHLRRARRLRRIRLSGSSTLAALRT